MEKAAKCFQTAKELEPQNTEIEYFLSELGQHKDAYVARQRHIREIFDGYADSFDTHLQEKLEYRIPDLLARVLQETGIMERRGLNVIDLGCGTGLCGPLFRNVAARLVGVDLSPRMLEKAGERRVYDELREADIIDVLQNSANAFDLVLAADVFIYVGGLAPVFVACNKALRQGGLFAFSVESVESGDFLLRASGRYGQSLRYIRELAGKHGFDIAIVREAVIRKEGQQPIPGHVFVLNKKPDGQP
jgi:predicted TPR repeat methyltransferase